MRRFIGHIGGWTLAGVMFCLIAPPAAAAAPSIELWGLVESNSLVGTFAAVREFERRTGIRVVVGTPGGQGELDPQKLLTAVTSHTTPDVIWFGRHAMGIWAPRRAFLPLDDFIRRDAINLDEFYPGTVAEAQWEGKTYALPWNVDCRILFCNMKLLREHGFGRPPRTWEELERYATAMTHFNEVRSRYDLLGFAPNYGNAWLYLYAWQLGAKWLSEDGRTSLVAAPEVVNALTWMVKMSDAVGGAERVQAFTASAQLEGMGDPFLSQRIAMQMNGSYVLDYIGRWGAQLDFELVPPPVPEEGMPPLSWSGGFSWVIPTDARHPEEAWQFIRWMNSEEAWGVQCEEQKQYGRRESGETSVFVPLFHANRVINERLTQRYLADAPEKFRKANQACLDLLPHCRFRPVTPACAELWDAQQNAFVNAQFHLRSPAEELTLQHLRVQSALDRYFQPPQGPVLSARSVALGVALAEALLLASGVLLFTRALRARSAPERRKALTGVAYAAPWVIGFAVFVLGPMAYSLVMAFTRYDVVHPPEFIGLGNWARMFGFQEGPDGLLANDPQFWKSLWNTLYMTIFGVPAGMAASLAIAMLLNTKVRGMGLYRTLYYLPVIVPAVAGAFIWLWLLNPETGFVNFVLAPWLHKLGLSAPAWFTDARWAKPGLIILMIWTCGGTVIIWLAGLQTLPRHLYEAAMIDGATPLRRFWHITFPLLTPYLLFNWIMGTIGSLQIFTQAYIINAPGDSMLFYVLYLFFRAFRYFEMGYACAMAWVLFAITVALCLLQLWMSRRWVYYESES